MCNAGGKVDTGWRRAITTCGGEKWSANNGSSVRKMARSTLSIEVSPAVLGDARPQLRLVVGTESLGVGVEDRLVVGR